jgi:hypothetical protein
MLVHLMKVLVYVNPVTAVDTEHNICAGPFGTT